MVNDISRPDIGFDAADNEVTIVTAAGDERRCRARSKAEIARAILDDGRRPARRARPRGAAR